MFHSAYCVVFCEMQSARLQEIETLYSSSEFFSFSFLGWQDGIFNVVLTVSLILLVAEVIGF